MVRQELKKNWRWYVALVLIIGSQILGSAQSYNNSLAACERGNPLRSVVYNLANTASEKATRGNALYEQQLDRLKVTPTTNANGEVDCQVLVVKPFLVP